MKSCITTSIFSLLILLVSSSSAFCDEQAPFLPTWKLLSSDAKEQFIAGYLQGWKDAEQVTEIATQYVKENPQKALEGLEKVRSLYDMSSLTSSAIAREVDQFYQNPSNGSAGLAKAVTVAKQRLGH